MSENEIPTMIGHGIPPGPLEDAISRACTALIERAHRAEVRARFLERELREARQRLGVCLYCGDPMSDAYKSHRLCAQCGAEIMRGETPKGYGVVGGIGFIGPRFRPGNEASPYQENAIRALEGD